MVFLNIRNQIKLLLKIKVNNDMTIELNKVSSILSQYGIEEANLIDFYLLDFFRFFLEKKFKFCAPIASNYNTIFFIPLKITIFRDDLETDIKIFFFDEKFLIKLFLDNKITFTKFNIFLLKYLSLKGNIYSNFFSKFLSVDGFLYTFKNRDFFRARKINFRRKLHQNSYNE